MSASASSHASVIGAWLASDMLLIPRSRYKPGCYTRPMKEILNVKTQQAS